MFTTLISVALLALPALATTFSIETPESLVACSSQQFIWSGGEPPYNLVIVASDDPCGDILVELGTHNSTSITWDSVLLPADFTGTSVSLSLEDANQDEAWSTSIPYTHGSNTTCLPASSSSVAPGTSTIPPAPLVTAIAPTETSNAAPVGAAANAGEIPLGNGAFSRQMSGSALIASALIGAIALSL